MADPVAGAGAFEALTQEVARAAWTNFNAIQAAGGLSNALSHGVIADGVEADLDRLRQAFASGGVRIVGVTDFRSEEILPALFEPLPETEGDVPSAGLPGPDSHCPPLTPIRLEELAA